MAEPVSVAEARAQLNLYDDTSQDGRIEPLIVAAREWVEAYTGQVLTARQVVEQAPAFDGRIFLDAWPIRTLSSIAYFDAAGVQQALPIGDVLASLALRPSRFIAGLGKAFPATVARGDAITITVQAGYATPEAVPQSLKQAILILVTSWFDDRGGSDIPPAVLALCRSHRLMSI